MAFHRSSLLVVFVRGVQWGHNQESFPKDKVWQASWPLDLIDSDICGPMATNSLGGSQYFLTFIDAFSRFLRIYTFKSNDEVFGKLREFKSLVEIESKRKIKCLRTNGRG
jgi:hypothetical protein